MRGRSGTGKTKPAKGKGLGENTSLSPGTLQATPRALSPLGREVLVMMDPAGLSLLFVSLQRNPGQKTPTVSPNISEHRLGSRLFLQGKYKFSKGSWLLPGLLTLPLP